VLAFIDSYNETCQSAAVFIVVNVICTAVMNEGRPSGRRDAWVAASCVRP